jgi:hypothetical protein
VAVCNRRCAAPCKELILKSLRRGGPSPHGGRRPDGGARRSPSPRPGTDGHAGGQGVAGGADVPKGEGPRLSPRTVDDATSGPSRCERGPGHACLADLAQGTVCKSSARTRGRSRRGPGCTASACRSASARTAAGEQRRSMARGQERPPVERTAPLPRSCPSGIRGFATMPPVRAPTLRRASPQIHAATGLGPPGQR